ncbi:MAG: hypothetical protein ABJN43_13010 [Sneathiella sp.]
MERHLSAILKADEVINKHGVRHQNILEHVAKVRGMKSGKLEGLKALPSAVQHLWDWFLLLADQYSTRDRQSMPRPQEIKEDLITLTGFEITPWEIMVIGSLLRYWQDSRTENHE